MTEKKCFLTFTLQYCAHSFKVWPLAQELLLKSNCLLPSTLSLPLIISTTSLKSPLFLCKNKVVNFLAVGFPIWSMSHRQHYACIKEVFGPPCFLSNIGSKPEWYTLIDVFTRYLYSFYRSGCLDSNFLLTNDSQYYA